MTYHVLARKWRPQTFADLVGQTHVVKALTYALSRNQIHHAYLFSGTRGVGKTSIARIFAKSLNCERNGVSANPCGECESCREIKAGKFVDLIEVDAASRTGVDETRELIDSVAYMPTKGRYKVYLIDEVHMFSKSSFNALLKTLEEPPAYVKFILATTDPEKLPITILSRCLQFNLKSLTSAQIRQHLANICRAESIHYDDEALALLASAGDGSMRDTLSMTDQAIAYGAGTLSLAAVSEILGTIKPADIEAILFAVATNNPNQLSVALNRLDDYEVDARAFLIEIMRRLQQMAWVKEGIAKSLSPALQSTVSDIPKPLLHLWYDIAQKALPDLAIAGEPRQAVEMALLRMLAFIPDDWVVRHRTLLETPSAAPPPETIVQTGTNTTHAGHTESTVHTGRTESAERTENTEVAKAEPVKAEGFAAQVQAIPIAEHATLDEAEAGFTELQTTEDVPISTEGWHLSRQNDSAPPPSMETIHVMMQRGSDLKAPPPKSVAPQEPVVAPQEAVAPQEPVVALQEAVAPQEPVVAPQETVASQEPVTPKNSPAQPTPLAIDVDAFDWYQTLEELGLSDYTHHFVSMGILRLRMVDDGIVGVRATLDLSPKHEVMITDDSLSELSQALQNHFDAPIEVDIRLTTIDEQTPAERTKLASEVQQADWLKQFESHPITVKIRQALGGQVIAKTVKARG